MTRARVVVDPSCDPSTPLVVTSDHTKQVNGDCYRLNTKSLVPQKWKVNGDVNGVNGDVEEGNGDL